MFASYTVFQHTIDKTCIKTITRTNGAHRLYLPCRIAFSQSAVGPYDISAL